MFGTAGLLFALVGVVIAILLIRSVLKRNRVLATGVTVEARCLDTYSRSNTEGASTRHAVLTFTTREGREIRIQPAIHTPIVPGDFVTVRYDPERPELAFLVEVGGGAATGCGLLIALVVCAMFVLVGLLFAGGGFGLWAFMSSTSSDPSTYVPDPSFTP
ncbi:DUF3592 domain-containing protein [Streptacidiphilus sp. PAMC 29251]